MMHRKPSDRFISDFSAESLKRRSVKNANEIKNHQRTNSFDYSEQSSSSSSLSPSSSASSPSQNATNIAFHFAQPTEWNTILQQPFGGSVPFRPLNYTFDEAQHKKILQMLTSDTHEMNWSCRQCSYANNALHVNICERCRSSRAVVSQNSRNIVSSDQQWKNQQDMLQQRKDDVPVVEDQGWICRSCTLINKSNSSSCAACEIKLQSLSILDDTASQKHECWLCPLCTLENPTTALECAACQTARVKSRSLDGSKNSKLLMMPQVKSNCKKLKQKGKKRVQNYPAASTTLKADTAKSNNGQKTNYNPVSAVYKGLSHYMNPWRCLVCTFENSRSEIICDMCQNMHNSISETNQPTQLSPEEIADLQWNYVVSECKLQRKLYVDETFPAADISLFYSPAEHKHEDVKWLRLRSVMVDKVDEHLPWVVFRNLLKPTDVCQGELGDCWLVSALSVLVEREDLVRAAIITKQLCPQGMYQVRLCKDGNWTMVTVDDIFPCDTDRILLYSQAIRKQLWVPLIEKAFAKINGCYEALTFGSIIEGLATLTGAPCENIPLQPISPSDTIDADFIWAQLESARRALFLMGTVCGGDNVKAEEAEIEKKGLHACHVYSILDVICISKHRLLQLRDPYGEYGSTPTSGTPQLHNKLQSIEPKNGVFWIDFNDILKYFSCIGICKIRTGWFEMRLSGFLPKWASLHELSSVLLTVDEPTGVDLILYQKSQREIEKSKRNKVDLCLVLFKANGESSYSLVTSSKRQVQGFVGCYRLLEPGEYIAIPITFNYCHLELAPESNLQYVLAVHSSKKVSATQVTSSPQALADIIISLALVQGQHRELLKEFTVHYLTKDFSGAAIVADNRYENKWVHLKCKGDNKESCNIVSTRGLKNTVDAIPPLHRQVVAVFTQLRENENFFTSHQLDYRVADSAGLGDWGGSDMSHIPEIDYQTDGLHIPRLIDEI